MYPAVEADAPVTVWLNGGPGASSIMGNFLFSSPLTISQDPTTGAFNMHNTDASWISASTVIYIDQPVGTGFSYGEPVLTNMDDVTREFIYFLT